MKYCWEYTDDYLEYRSSLGLDIRNPGYYIKDFSRYLRNTYPNNHHQGNGFSLVHHKI